MRYAVTFSVSGPEIDEWNPCDMDVRGFINACPFDLDETEPGNSEYAYLAEEDPESDWVRAIDATGSTILETDEALSEFLGDCGLMLEYCYTLGTLGGPASPCGLAPDVSFWAESSLAVVSCRVTPLPNHNTPESYAHALRRLVSVALACSMYQAREAYWLALGKLLDGTLPEGPYYSLREWDLRELNRNVRWLRETLALPEDSAA